MSFIPNAAQIDKATFTEGVTPVTPIGGEWNDTSATLTTGQVAGLRITEKRAAHVNLRTEAGVELGGSTPLAVSGTVAVSTLPALAAGANAIGTVTVANQPALVAGSAAIGSVSVSNLPATQPVSGTVAVSSLPALVAGSAAIGSVSVSALPALPAGANAIGTVSDSTLAAIITSGKAAVTDAAAEASLASLAALIVSGKLTVSDSALDALIASGALAVKDATLDALISGGKLAVSDALLEAVISGGNVKVAPQTSNLVTGSGGTLYPQLIGNLMIVSASYTTTTKILTATVGYYVTAYVFTINPAATQASGAPIAVGLYDVSGGTTTYLAYYLVNVPATVASPLPTYPTFTAPAGFFWNNKVSGSALWMVVSSPLTAGAAGLMLNYGLCSFVG
jgi:hypothetical protein